MNAAQGVTGALAPPRGASIRSLGRSSVTLTVVSGLVLVLAWEVLGRQFPQKASYPSAVTTAFVEITFGDGALVDALGATLLGMAVGFLIAGVMGIGIGFAMGRIPVVAGLLEPYVNAIYATPRIALIPLLVLWFGIGFELRVTVAVLSAIFPIILNTYVGASTIDRGLLDAGRSLNASGFQLLRTIVVPASLPMVVTGLRIGGFRALVGIIVAEMTASITGTGQLLLTYGRFLQTAHLIAVIITLGIIGVLLTKVMGSAERAAMPWTRQRRS